MDHNKRTKILIEMGIPDQLRNLCVGQEETIRTRDRKTKWFQTGKGLFSFQSQRKAMPKHAQTTEQLHSFHMLAK